MNSVPSETAGAARLAPNPNPKCPMNIVVSDRNDILNRRMRLIGAEAGAGAVVAWLASIGHRRVRGRPAWLFDRAARRPSRSPPSRRRSIWLRLRRSSQPDAAALAAFGSVVVATFAWLMWRARPDYLPTGTGSDLAHHLALLSYIEAHGRLAHDAGAGAYLGEMIDYTPGAHFLAVLAGRWLHSDALHAVHGTIALTVALKSGIVFLIARRLMPAEVPRIPFAITAVLLLWLPFVFFVGSFMTESFLSQVVSELFAVALWWVLVVWDEQPNREAMALFALFGVATFLTWPVWIGPLVLLLAALVLMHRELAWRQRLQDLAIALVPVGIVAVIYTSFRLVYGLGMVHAVGFAIWPSPRTLGATFIILGSLGFLRSLVTGQARSVALLFLAIVLQGAALIVTGLNSGATAPYLSLKMTYLAIYPLAVGGATVLASLWRALRPIGRYAWLPVLFVALEAGRAIAVRGSCPAGRVAAGVSRKRLGADAIRARLCRLSHQGRLHRLLAPPRGVRQPARRRTRARGRHIRSEEGDRSLDPARWTALRDRGRFRPAAPRHPLERRRPRPLRTRGGRAAPRHIGLRITLRRAAETAKHARRT